MLKKIPIKKKEDSMKSLSILKTLLAKRATVDKQILDTEKKLIAEAEAVEKASTKPAAKKPATRKATAKKAAKKPVASKP
jgi:hypothetical protein